MGGPAATAPAAVTSPRVLRWRSNDTGIHSVNAGIPLEGLQRGPASVKSSPALPVAFF